MNKSNINSPTLCLNMIVKNESKIITRLFDSVVSIIDCYCICDTGSTDNTIELIKNYFLEKNIPGKVIQEPFQNFAHNRSFALKACMGMSDYVLLLDADMTIDIHNFDKNILNKYDTFTILQGNENYYYYNKRIVKNDGLYNYVGVTHEYINTPQQCTSYDFKKNELFIVDIGDGGAKQDKFERDIRLLLDGIQKEPRNERYHFYLANSYKDTGKLTEAIEYYKKRIEFGGWNQEIWQSMYRIGFCYKDMGNISEAIHWWLNAYEIIPERIENLYEIVKYYRENNKSKLAHQFYNIALESLNKKDNRDQYLFLQNDVYTYKLFYEYTIFAYYIGVRNIDDKIIEILNVKSMDHSIYRNILNNFKFYREILKPITTINLSNELEIKVADTPTKFWSSSSCLISVKDGYVLNTRYVNYYIRNENGSYMYCDQHIITANQNTHFNKDFSVKDAKLFDLNYENRRYIGIEDVKIFEDVETNKLIFTGTGFHKNRLIGIMYGNYDINNDKLLGNEVTCSFNQCECEKNWVFVDYKGSTHIVYNWYPLQICKLNEEKTTIHKVIEKETPAIFSYFRGSSSSFKYYKKINLDKKYSNKNSKEGTEGEIQLDMFETELWFIVHMVSYELPRHYYHVFVVFDEEMNFLRYSAPFKFEGTPIEYCLSVVVEDERVIVNYSCWDRTTQIAIYDKNYIDSIVKYT